MPLQYTLDGKELKTILSTHQDSCSLDLSNTRKIVDPNFSIQLTKTYTDLISSFLCLYQKYKRSDQQKGQDKILIIKQLIPISKRNKTETKIANRKN